MKILLSGANGFTGRYICRELQKNNLNFFALIRHGNDTTWLKKNRIKYIYADLNVYDDLYKAFEEIDVLINAASLGFGSAPIIVKACMARKLKRVIFISTTGIFTSLNPISKSIRIEAEKIINESKLDWTIFRPTMIYGDLGDRNIIKLIKLIFYFPIIPVFGSGNNLLQPVNVRDISESVVKVINLKNTFRKTFNLSGANPITITKLIDIVSKTLNKKVYKLYFPPFLAIMILSITEKFNLKLPIAKEQVQRLLEDKDFSHNKAKLEFGYNPMDIELGVKKEVELFINKKKYK